MKKKVFATLLAVSMIASMVPAAVSVQAADGDSIRLVNGKKSNPWAVESIFRVL